jgi:predicted TIM-barrel fold metal-dependent hydrolase
VRFPKDRRLGLALLPTHDVDAAVQEVQWAAKAGLRGIILPFFNYDLPEYTNRYWERIWSICEETGLMINFHGGNGGPEMGKYRYLWMLEHMFWPKRTISQMIFSGVFDRHPKLHCTLTEAHAGWIPEAMKEFDKFVDGQSAGSRDVNNALITDGALPARRPSEYWHDNWLAGLLNNKSRRNASASPKFNRGARDIVVGDRCHLEM